MLREATGLLSYHSKYTSRRAQHDVHNVFIKAMSHLAQCGFDTLKGKRVLDLGCGQRFPFALQCAAHGAKVTALDLNYVKPDALIVAFYHQVRCNGIKRAVKSAFRRVMFDRQYYHVLEDSSGMPPRLHQTEINFVVADPTSSTYPLPSTSFDLISSNAVLEHVEDIDQVAAESARLLSPGGYLYSIIHNFYSLSGGHNPAWAFPDDNPPSGVPAWDHLRENRFPAWLYLNRYKPEQFRDAFSKHMQVIRFEGVGIDHDAGKLEGERYLTPEIRAELQAYPRDLLLTRSWCIICKKA
jgi:SAM-dependent methyltransferase